MTEICKCGHEEDWHGERFCKDSSNCPCKKFEPQEGCGKIGYIEEEDCHCFCCGSHDGKPKNHSPEKVASPIRRQDTPEDVHHPEIKESSGTYNLSDERNEIYILMRKRKISIRDADSVFKLIKKQDKEFIQRLKEVFPQIYEEQTQEYLGEFIHHEINKLAGNLK